MTNDHYPAATAGNYLEEARIAAENLVRHLDRMAEDSAPMPEGWDVAYRIAIAARAIYQTMDTLMRPAIDADEARRLDDEWGGYTILVHQRDWGILPTRRRGCTLLAARGPSCRPCLSLSLVENIGSRRSGC